MKRSTHMHSSDFWQKVPKESNGKRKICLANDAGTAEYSRKKMNLNPNFIPCTEVNLRYIIDPNEKVKN